ncbi:Cholesteryl Ester Transfer Protein [Manis pentadactyla]|nr:Cholesteryl Ester Transfer Protein [Manis pentadactyla]
MADKGHLADGPEPHQDRVGNLQTTVNQEITKLIQTPLQQASYSDIKGERSWWSLAESSMVCSTAAGSQPQPLSSPRLLSVSRRARRSRERSRDLAYGHNPQIHLKAHALGPGTHETISTNTLEHL